MPLLAARTTIPESDTVILLRDYSWPAFSIALVKLLPVALVFILGFLLLDRLG